MMNDFILKMFETFGAVCKDADGNEVMKTALIDPCPGGTWSSDGTAIFDILSIALNIATFGVAAAAIIGIIISGYQYMSARDNSAAVVKAKNRILQVVIGLVIWGLFWGVLQFLLPGGLFANGGTSM